MNGIAAHLLGADELGQTEEDEQGGEEVGGAGVGEPELDACEAVELGLGGLGGAGELAGHDEHGGQQEAEDEGGLIVEAMGEGGGGGQDGEDEEEGDGGDDAQGELLVEIHDDLWGEVGGVCPGQGHNTGARVGRGRRWGREAA